MCSDCVDVALSRCSNCSAAVCADCRFDEESIGNAWPAVLLCTVCTEWIHSTGALPSSDALEQDWWIRDLDSDMQHYDRGKHESKFGGVPTACYVFDEWVCTCVVGCLIHNLNVFARCRAFGFPVHHSLQKARKGKCILALLFPYVL
jgi:hypothetical protein